MAQARVDAQAARRQLLTRFDYDESLMRNDCVCVSYPNAQLAATVPDIERVTAVCRDIHDWVAAIGSSIMLLDGSNRATNDETSVVAAAIVSSTLARMDPEETTFKILPLAFFCGRHRDDRYGTVTQMAMSLLLTLVNFYEDFDADTLRECIEEVDERDFKSILDAFEKLITKLSNDAFVFLIIEDVGAFCHPEDRRVQMEEALRRLIRLTHRDTQATLKFLFTDAARTESILQSFSEDEIQSVSRYGESGDAD
ncbi:hypothetical protein GGR52DRAFT_536305 [Hypoxylon sp. FL1284]|nr:hypothetical protein GGR52DRAFT_536305 [Hypoxylon sp. FL1284]